VGLIFSFIRSKQVLALCLSLQVVANEAEIDVEENKKAQSNKECDKKATRAAAKRIW
jgi:anthranilate/para-aminobenzoate synthase component II